MLFQHYTIYKTTNKITSEIYIGCHKTNNLNDNYKGSGSLIRKKLQEYGKENFSKEILFDFNNPEDMSNKEREIVNEDFVKDNNNYNLRIGGGSLYDRRFKDVITLDKQILSLIDRYTTDEICERLEIKKYRITNCLVKHGLTYKDVYNKPRIRKSQYIYIKENYKELRISSISKILDMDVDIVKFIIERIHPGFKFRLIYKEDLIDLYLRKNLSLKDISNAYLCTQSNLSGFVKEYNILEIKKRLLNIRKIRNFKQEYNGKNKKELFKKLKINTSWLVKNKIYLK